MELKSKSRKSDLVIEELAEYMKLLPWRSLQGIKDDKLLISASSRVAAKEFGLDEMVTKFQRSVMYVMIVFHWIVLFIFSLF